MQTKFLEDKKAGRDKTVTSSGPENSCFQMEAVRRPGLCA